MEIDLSWLGRGKGIARHGEAGRAYESSIEVDGRDVQAITEDKKRWRQRLSQRGE